MIAQAAAAGMGLALLPQFLVEKELEIGRLEILSHMMLRLGSGYYLVLPQTGMTTGAEWLRDWITGLAKHS